MKQITVSKTVYTLDELSDIAREKAYENMAQLLSEWFEQSEITEELNGELYAKLTGRQLGQISSKKLKTDCGLTIEWSLNYSQGDGVAIYGEVYASEAPMLDWYNAQSARLTRNYHAYSHYNTFDVEVFGEDECGNYTTLDGDIGEIITEQFRNICRELARHGYAHMDHLTSKEAIDSWLENDHEPRRFDENGDLVEPNFWGTK